MIISLTGPMGCGKSSVGRKLTALLRAECSDPQEAERRVMLLDLDEYIVNREGRSIPEIFEAGGEDAFRQMETAALEEIVLSHKAEGAPDILVLSLGGGAVLRNSDLLRSRTVCIFLDASLDTLVSRLQGNTAGRPLLSSESTESLRGKLSSILESRRALYEKAAMFVLNSDGKNVYDTASEIISMLKNA